MKKIALLILVAAFPAILPGQGDDQFLPSELKQATVITEPATLRKGFLRVGFDWNYGGIKKIFNEQTKKIFTPGSSIGRSSMFEASVQYGLTDRIQANLTMPYMMDLVQGSIILDDPLFQQKKQVDFEQRGFGPGDLALGVYTQLLKESEAIPSVTLRTTVMLPTGRKNPGDFSSDSLIYHTSTGSGEVSLAIDLQARKIMYPYSFVVYGGIDYGFGGEKVIEVGMPEQSFRSGMTAYLAGGFNFHLNDWICMTNDVYYTRIGKETINNIQQDETKWQLMYIPYIHFQIKQLRLVQGVFVPLKGKLISADPSYIFIAQFVF
jgi:hypothetical protein